MRTPMGKFMAVSRIDIQVAIDQNIVHPMELIRIFIHRVEKYNLFLQGLPSREALLIL